MKKVLLIAAGLMLAISAQAGTVKKQGNRAAQRLTSKIIAHGGCPVIGGANTTAWSNRKDETEWRAKRIPGACSGKFTKFKHKGQNYLGIDSRCSNIVVGVSRYNRTTRTMELYKNKGAGRAFFQIAKKYAYSADGTDFRVVISSSTGKNCAILDVKF